MTLEKQIQLFHGSDRHTKDLLEVNDDGIFGGVFAHPDKCWASPLGVGKGDLYQVFLKRSEILTQSELSYSLDNEKITAILKNHWQDADQELLHEAVVEDENVFTSEFDSLVQEIGSGDPDEASWEAQRLRGVIAKEFGYKAVEMQDERGTSYLVLSPTVLTKV